ncbi:glycosyltransferase family 2 protein [Alkalicoccus daliensis]|uniref:Teichuronic acid biosynthesis glycosyltransferase TuaG n=1 Tax=Alkalicoccus daliensis TaxID=745820 RepID=A0A1H0GJ16_9BACI|nr:glycosyltransferase family 2 protein [Alkalicoccus daliensis]SDO06853.1 teichuronic acid biosynthesis glycosyltransferase TuaG [Alkalicoccus daliensis]
MTQAEKNEGQPLISVITPAYNAAAFIEKTIRSVQAQTYENWEMIITDDCSKDETIKVIQKLQQEDKRIHLLQLETNQGAAVARNTSIEAAKGRFIAFLDSDDQWLPEKLQKQLQWMQERNIAFSFTPYYVVDEQDRQLGLGDIVPTRVTYQDLLKQNVVGCLTVMLDIEKIGTIRMVNIRTRQDYVLWLELCKRGFDAYGMSEPLALYRRQTESISSNKKEMAKQNWKVYREVEKLNLLQSSWYFAHYAFNKINKYRG